MDLYDHQGDKPDYHYECIEMVSNTNILAQRSKEVAFNYMDHLEGWCTHNKASVLVDLIFMLKPKIVVEIGVWGGKSLVPMGLALKVNGRGKAYGIDPWDSGASSEGMDGVNYDWWSQVDHQMILRGLQAKISEYNLQANIELIKSTSENAPLIPNIDILHIDGNHSEKAANLDAHKWVPLVRRGGIIIFDDITWGTTASAVKWMDENCIRLAEFHEDNDWGIWVKP